MTDNHKSSERRRHFAMKNERRRQVRAQGPAAVLANRQMGRLLALRLWRRDSSASKTAS